MNTCITEAVEKLNAIIDCGSPKYQARAWEKNGHRRVYVDLRTGKSRSDELGFIDLAKSFGVCTAYKKTKQTAFFQAVEIVLGISKEESEARRETDKQAYWDSVKAPKSALPNEDEEDDELARDVCGDERA